MCEAGDVDEAVPRSDGGRCSEISPSSCSGRPDKTSCVTRDVTLTTVVPGKEIPGWQVRSRLQELFFTPQSTSLKSAFSAWPGWCYPNTHTSLNNPSILDSHAHLEVLWHTGSPGAPRPGRSSDATAGGRPGRNVRRKKGGKCCGSGRDCPRCL